MGISKSPQELAAKFDGLGHDLQQQQSKSLVKAANVAKLSLLAAPGAPKGSMSGVGKNGTKVGVRYKIMGEQASIRWLGPVHLVNNPTKAHDIGPKKKGRVANRKSAVSFGGSAYARVHRPATHGKHFFESGREVAEKAAPKAFNADMRGVIANRFK